MPPQDAVVAPGMPPPPVAQLGAEAPVAAPADSGRNLLAQLGISGSALESLDVARQRSSVANEAALAQVAANQGAYADATQPPPPRPAPPTLQEVPAPPTQEPTDPLRVFAQTLPILAMLGGAFIRNNATGALRAGAAAMQAARDNDEQALEQAHQQWTDSLQAITTNNATRLQQYQAILDDSRLSMDERMAQLQALAASEQNALRLQQLASGQVSELTEGVMLEMRANEILTNAFLQQQEINARLALGGQARPLRGTDGALMTRIRESAESARGLRGFTQEFNQSLERARARGVALGPGSGVQIWDPDVANMSALGARMLGLMRPTGSGATSDFEQRIYARGAPGIDRTPEANAAIIDGIERLGAISDARQFFYEDFAANNGHLNGAEQAFQSSPEFQSLAIDANNAPPASGGAENDPLGIRGDGTVSH